MIKKPKNQMVRFKKQKASYFQEKSVNRRIGWRGKFNVELDGYYNLKRNKNNFRRVGRKSSKMNMSHGGGLRRYKKK